ncbi:MAG: hypothetical protein ACD_79C00709G0002 [uncultured bacterium]|nr:MAG: hypothetical protein ACD_79C00709G0002 [uncultured bacterium]
MTDDFNEKRLSARIKGNFKIKITDDDETITVNSIDLSSSGLCFKSSKNIPLFREINFSILLPLEKGKKEKNFSCSAIVVRSEKSHYNDMYNIALTFVDIEDDDKEKLIKFLENVVNLKEDLNDNS